MSPTWSDIKVGVTVTSDDSGTYIKLDRKKWYSAPALKYLAAELIGFADYGLSKEVADPDSWRDAVTDKANGVKVVELREVVLDGHKLTTEPKVVRMIYFGEEIKLKDIDRLFPEDGSSYIGNTRASLRNNIKYGSRAVYTRHNQVLYIAKQDEVIKL